MPRSPHSALCPRRPDGPASIQRVLGVLFGGLSALLLGPTASGEVPAASGSDVRLVVMVSVDQLIPQQLERLGPAFTGGFHRLLRDGARYREASLPYARTETGAGHVTFSTGCLPSTHGVVGNAFYGRALARNVYCVEDVDACAIQSSGRVEGTGRRSPINLLRPTLAEILQSKNAATRVVSISGKDRAAIGMAGRAKGLVLWWDKNGTGFQTSSFYGETLPSFVREWNRDWQAPYLGWVWNPVEARTEAEFERLGCAPDDRVGERPLGKMGVSFPYEFPAAPSPKTMGGLAFQTPLTDQFVVEMARAAVEQERLGADDDVDLLCLSFSGCDAVGHANGPYSREVTDLLQRLDRGLGALFTDLDSRVGEGRWMLALTSDHGVLPLPEYLQPRGIPAGRITRDQSAAFGRDLVARLEESVGAKVRFRNVAGGFRLDANDMSEASLDPAATRLAAARVVRELTEAHPWIETAYAYEELAALDEAASGIELLMRNSFHPERAPDVAVVHARGYLKALQVGTSHGSPYDYDRHVPMLFMGPGFRAGVSSRPVGSQDIVPTLLGQLGFRAQEMGFDGVDLAGDR